MASLALLASACDASSGDSSAPPPPPASRFEAVAPKATANGDALSGFCDAHADVGKGRPFRYPPVEGVAPAVGSGGLLWVNLWATWCKPCVEELPMIASWQKDLASKGQKLELRFVSVDEDAKVIEAFRSAHPGTPETMKISSASALAPYIAELGLDSGAGRPIHVFVDGSSHIRCVRAGAVADTHLPVITSMLR